MSSTASSSIARRTQTGGHTSPRMCSLSASPLPTPSTNRPLSCTAAVAAAWAMIAGWMRTVGQVTAVVTGSVTASDSAPITDQTNGLWPCAPVHGWKWSEIHNRSKPACSASRACRTSSFGPNSSQDRKYPMLTMSRDTPVSEARTERWAGLSRGLQEIGEQGCGALGCFLLHEMADAGQHLVAVAVTDPTRGPPRGALQHVRVIDAVHLEHRHPDGPVHRAGQPAPIEAEL